MHREFNQAHFTNTQGKGSDIDDGDPVGRAYVGPSGFLLRKTLIYTPSG